MPSPKAKRSDSVSFTKFRRIHLAAIRQLRSSLDAIDTTPADATFIAWAMEHALVQGRYADAVELAKALSQQQYGDAESFRIGIQLAALVSKVPFRDPSLDPTGKALDQLLQGEVRINSCNKDLRELGHALGLWWSEGSDALSIDEEVKPLVELLVKARGHIHRALGKFPMQDMVDRCRLGKGSSVGVRGDATHLLRKMSAETWTCSRLAYPYVYRCCVNSPEFWRALGLEKEMETIPSLYTDPYGRYMRATPGACFAMKHAMQDALMKFKEAFSARVVFVDADEITTVKKKADIDRTVSVQPLLNLLPQLGINDVMVEILLRQCNIDIREGQKKVNGALAHLASFCDGTTMATLDLTNASNNISYMLVKLLFPSDWYEVLNAIRTPGFKIPVKELKEPFSYEMIAPMGNGFCFPVETLVFWGLIQAVYDVVEVPDRTCAVYGDDIIVYQPAALLLIELLELVGSEVNIAKSFIHGPFRESCGQDFFNGINVRPVVVDEIFETWPQVFHFINSMARKGYTSLAKDLRQLVPHENRFCRPYCGETNTALEVPLDEFMASPFARFDADRQGWSWLEYITTSVQDPEAYDEANQLTAILQGCRPVDYQARGTFRRKTVTRVHRTPKPLTAEERTRLAA